LGRREVIGEDTEEGLFDCGEGGWTKKVGISEPELQKSKLRATPFPSTAGTTTGAPKVEQMYKFFEKHKKMAQRP
jgi:hypothetical protein